MYLYTVIWRQTYIYSIVVDVQDPRLKNNKEIKVICQNTVLVFLHHSGGLRRQASKFHWAGYICISLWTLHKTKNACKMTVDVPDFHTFDEEHEQYTTYHYTLFVLFQNTLNTPLFV